MFNTNDLIRLLYSQQAYTALRMTLGTMLPGIVLILIFNQFVAGIACALGAFCTSMVDVPAPLWRKHRHMLLGTFVVGIVSWLSILSFQHPIALWSMLLGVCFLSGVAVAYGTLATAMGIAAMMAVVMALAEHSADVDLWVYLAWVIIGGLWYTYFCLATCRLFQHQMARRVLGECLFATADYLAARSQFYMPAIPLEQCHRTMMTTQVAVIEAQQAARDLVLNNLFVGKCSPNDPERIRLFNILTDIIDMHDSVLAMQTNFDSLRNDFEQTDALDFMRDLLRKTSRELSRVAIAVVKGGALTHRFNIKAELRALEYEVELAHNVSAVPVLKAAWSRGRTISLMMEKLIQDLQSTTNTSGISLEVIEQRYYRPSQKKHIEHLQWSSPALRFALRLTLAIAFGMAISEYFGAHRIWIIITIMVVLRPGFGLSQQRNKHRLIGTLLGCLATPIIFWGVPQHTMQFWIMAGSFFLCFSFARLNYLISVFFTTIALLLLYHFMAPQLTLVGERAIDTLIGTVIGAVAGYVFPTWEFQLLAPQIAAALRSFRRYAKEVFAPILNAADYRIARRDALVDLTALSASYQRLLQDPIKKQIQAHEVGELVLQCNVLVSEIATLAHMRSENKELSELAEFKSVAKTIDAALAGTSVEITDDSLLPSSDELLSAQQSAMNMMKVCGQLELPGLKNMLKNIRASNS
jgi:uncharacterized membrane protein YccC